MIKLENHGIRLHFDTRGIFMNCVDMDVPKGNPMISIIHSFDEVIVPPSEVHYGNNSLRLTSKDDVANYITLLIYLPEGNSR